MTSVATDPTDGAMDCLDGDDTIARGGGGAMIQGGNGNDNMHTETVTALQ